MTRQRRILLWVGLGLSLSGTAYAALGFVYFTWLQGVQSPPGWAAVVAWSCLAAAVLLAGTFVYCLVRLAWDPARRQRAR